MGYILLNLQAWNLGIHAHLDMIEDAIIRALKTLGLDTGREEGMTGVWTKGADPKKLCAIGVTAKKLGDVPRVLPQRRSGSRSL